MFFQNLLAVNDSEDLKYNFYYYRTVSGSEVDFIAYGPNGFHAFEIKSSQNITSKHLKGLKKFAKDYPEAKLHIFYMGNQTRYEGSVTIHPFEKDILNLSTILKINSKIEAVFGSKILQCFPGIIFYCHWNTCSI